MKWTVLLLLFGGVIDDPGPPPWLDPFYPYPPNLPTPDTPDDPCPDDNDGDWDLLVIELGWMEVGR